MLIRYSTAIKTQHVTPPAATADKVRARVSGNLHRGNEFDEIWIDTSDSFEPTVEARLRGRKVAWWGGSAAEYIFYQIYLAFPEILES